MSNRNNEELLEKFYDEFLAEGFDETDAEWLAYEKLEESGK